MQHYAWIPFMFQFISKLEALPTLEFSSTLYSTYMFEPIFILIWMQHYTWIHLFAWIYLYAWVHLDGWIEQYAESTGTLESTSTFGSTYA